MAKTRRTRINARPATVFGRNVRPAAVKPGHNLKTKGILIVDGEIKPNAQGVNKLAKPVFVDRVYTGVNKGKTYPYASTKRGGNAAQAD